jgi:hypothetical protein
MSVRLTMAKKEADGDIHLIVTSPSDQTKELVVEFPTLNCTDTSPKKQQMENALQDLLDACGPIISSHWTDLHHAKAYITGVPFFDFGHGKATRRTVPRSTLRLASLPRRAEEAERADRQRDPVANSGQPPMVSSSCRQMLSSRS